MRTYTGVGRGDAHLRACELERQAHSVVKISDLCYVNVTLGHGRAVKCAQVCGPQNIPILHACLCVRVWFPIAYANALV